MLCRVSPSCLCFAAFRRALLCGAVLCRARLCCAVPRLSPLSSHKAWRWQNQVTSTPRISRGMAILCITAATDCHALMQHRLPARSKKCAAVTWLRQTLSHPLAECLSRLAHPAKRGGRSSAPPNSHIPPRKHQNTLLIKYHMVRESSHVWRASLLTVYSRAELRDDVLHSLGKGVQRRDSRNLLVGLWAS